MPFDALTYKIIASELDLSLRGGRIERVGMPDKNNVLLQVRSVAGPSRRSDLLLLCADPSRPGLRLTRAGAENPLSAFSFLMHLRKRIGGGTITGVASVPHERIVRVSIEASDELGYRSEYILVSELVGRYPNIILVDKDGVITDSLRHVSFDEFSERAVLPNLKYSPPPAQNGKFPPEDSAVTAKLREFGGGKLAEYMMTCVYGYAPVTMREIVFRAYGSLTPDPEAVRRQPEAFARAAAELETAHSPCAVTADGRLREVFVCPYRHIAAEFVPFPTVNEAADAYYSSTESAGYMAGKTAALSSALKNAIKKNAKSLAVYRKQALDAADFERDRLAGELLTANIYRIKTGMTEIGVDNYYTGGRETIKLDPTLTPQQNAQKYFKAYSKKKSALSHAETQADAAVRRAEYLDSIAAALESVENEGDVAAVSAEMSAAGIIKPVGGGKKKVRPSRPLTLTVDGFKVMIGKSNIQNDELVRSSEGGWLWLHTQKIHGSHGIICATSVPQETINKVAAIVAHYSKASLGANVPVDYTLVKYVKKPSGALPGFVIYTHQKTVNVTPKPADK